MHALEDEASALAKEVGCVTCVLGDPSCGAAEGGMSAEEANSYFELQPMGPWPAGELSSQGCGQWAWVRAGTAWMPGCRLGLTGCCCAQGAEGSVQWGPGMPWHGAAAHIPCHPLCCTAPLPS